MAVEPETPTENLVWVFTDATWQDGAAGLGVVIYRPDGKELHTLTVASKTRSSTEAECEAARVGLQAARERGATEAELVTDCQAVVHLWEKDERFAHLRRQFVRCSIRQVPRQQNGRAHRLAHGKMERPPKQAGFRVAKLAKAQWFRPKCQRCREMQALTTAEAVDWRGYCGPCRRIMERRGEW
jgi:hypothetical protein